MCVGVGEEFELYVGMKNLHLTLSHCLYLSLSLPLSPSLSSSLSHPLSISFSPPPSLTSLSRVRSITTLFRDILMGQWPFKTVPSLPVL